MTAAPPPSAVYAADELQALQRRGVHIPAPQQVVIARDVPLEAIAAGAELRPFCRLEGAQTRVDAGAIIGVAGPATLQDSWVGAGARIGTLGAVTLRGVCAGPGTVLGCGVAEDAVFLGKDGPEPAFTTGYGFRVRSGSLYEEDASSAQHTDTKMTVLLPWVTLGSNLNFCDVLVAGGTGPGLGAFSEIGSGVIHFNFTPRGDKATGSLLGDVTRGVFLREQRLFIGGNSSLVGPLQADYGALCAAGGRYERALHAGLNVPASAGSDAHGGAEGAGAFDLEVYGSVHRILHSQVRLIAELAALDAWYAHGRALLAAGAADRAALYARGRAMVQLNLRERIAQLSLLARRMERSAALLEQRRPGDPRIAQQRALREAWPQIEAHLGSWERHASPPPAVLRAALEEGAAAHGPAYTAIMRGLPEPAVAAGQAWLAGIARALLPAALLARVPALPRSG